MINKLNNCIEYSFVIPVYNRPNEIKELLYSLTSQSVQNFEVVVVEDGSELKCEEICKEFQSKLDLKYYFKNNSGPGQSRNYGFEKAKGNYCIFLDSDCILPTNYFKIVHNTLNNSYCDAFGGPDKAHKNFSKFQKAVNYSMTSFLTTGGIRGNSERLDQFHPRSFNMGYSRTVFNKTKGFSKMRYGEDIDMSIRIIKCGFKSRLFKKAYVFHKRRTNFCQYFKQIFNSGIARINLSKKHPKSLKIIYCLPAIFIVGIVCLLLSSVLYSNYFLIPILVHMLIIFVDASHRNKDVLIGLMSVATSYTQLIAYGCGFIYALWNRIVKPLNININYSQK